MIDTPLYRVTYVGARQVVKILEKHDPLRSSGGHAFRGHSLRHRTIPLDEASAVQNYVEHMLLLLMEEESGVGGAMGPILEFVVMENVMERLFVWSLRRDFTDQSKLEQLRMYEMLIGQAKQPLLHHKPVLKPLMMLLSSCSGSASGQAGEAPEERHKQSFISFQTFHLFVLSVFILPVFVFCFFFFALILLLFCLINVSLLFR